MEATPENLTDLGHLAARLEAAIFAAGGPGLIARLRRVLQLSPGQIDALVAQINASLVEQGRPYEIVAVAGGYQFRTRREWSDFIGELQPERKLRLSPSALDTLAVVAYKQPITRPEVEDLRSVDCGAVLKSLTDRRLIRVIGRRDAPGKPALYGTTPYFLEAFGLRALHELPQLSEIAAQIAAEGTPVEHASAPEGAVHGAANGSHADEPALAEAEAAAAGTEPPIFEEGELVLGDVDPELDPELEAELDAELEDAVKPVLGADAPTAPLAAATADADPARADADERIESAQHESEREDEVEDEHEEDGDVPPPQPDDA